MKKKLVLFAIVLFALTTSFSFAQDGATTFKSKCAICHGPDGSGKTPMGEKLKILDLRSADVQKLSDAELTQIVAKGKDKMPAYDGKLTKEQIDQVIAHIRELAKKK
ncbi:MAG: cytochrome c [Acidobacteriia bacterium]|jgi:cytochrome c551|nr:cytochrome c [Terriglobia bacterium]